MISIWECETFYRPTDVLIAGSGLMGLWTALEIKKTAPHLNITIAEAQSVPAIASTRNAGFACFGSPSEIWADIELLGEDIVYGLFEMRFKGIQKIRNTFGDAMVGYDPCGGYEVFADNPEWQGSVLEDKLNEINKNLPSITGLEQTFVNVSEEFSSQGLAGFSKMVGNKLEGGLHSGLLIESLYNALIQKGVRFLFGHSVGHVSGEEGNLQAGLVTGLRRLAPIRCKRFLWATNAGLSKVNGLEDLIQPARGQVLVSPKMEGFRLKGTFHFDEGYYYFRNIGSRLLIGGARNKAFEEENTDKMEPTKQIREHLEAFVARHIPQVAGVLRGPGWMNWAGIMGISRHKQPFVTQISPGVYCAFACNGMGVALTPMIGEVAAEQLTNAMG